MAIHLVRTMEFALKRLFSLTVAVPKMRFALRKLPDRVSNDASYDDDDYYWVRAHQSHNATYITSTVTIRVTPRDDYLVSWGILALLLLITIAWASYQVYLERNIDRQQRRRRTIRSSSNTGGGGGVSTDSERVTENSSTAELTRCVFRRLVLFALISRFLCIPIMIWSDPVWCQFVGDTFPEMVFATAWTMLVTFFVQVVGIANGTGTNTTPSIVIQLTAYVVYASLIALELFNSVASVLLYALLCCIYAALLGTIAYFLPHLVSLLRPHDQSLAWRLITSTILCACLFTAHMVGFARIVVDPPQKVYWWWKYGCLEVLPSIVFMVLLRPSAHHKDRLSGGGANHHHHPSGDWKKPPAASNVSPGSLQRADSMGSNHSLSQAIAASGSGKNGHPKEGGSLLGKSPTPTYGATSNV